MLDYQIKHLKKKNILFKLDVKRKKEDLRIFFMKMSGEEMTTTEQNDFNNNQNKTKKCFKVSMSIIFMNCSKSANERQFWGPIYQKAKITY